MALVVDAFAVAGQALVARYLGEGRSAEARAVANRLLWMGLAAGVALAIAFALLRGVLPGLFSADAGVIAAVAQIYGFVALMQPLNAVVFVWDGIFMGGEAFAFLAWAMVLSALVAAVVLLLTLPLGWGLPGVWWGIVALMGVRALTMALRYADPRRWLASGR
jgi:MATE family multidrug resistance protein